MKTTQQDSVSLIEKQQEVIQQLQSGNEQLKRENGKQQLEIELLKEQLDLLRAHIFGSKSEKRAEQPPLPGQLSYLEDSAPEEPERSESEEPVQVPPHKRKKSGRKPLPEHLPRIVETIDIPESEKWCGCGLKLCRIGQEISEQLEYIRARLRVIRYIRYKYACEGCEGLETEGGTVKIASPPKVILPKSIASAGLLAQIMCDKFVDALPFYRQEKRFLRLGYEISRTNMANWAIKLGEILIPLCNLLREELLSGPLINMDETTLQVLKEAGRAPTSKSHMWVQRGGASGKPVIYFHYDPSRGSDVAQTLLEGYRGVLQTDGYSSYDFVEKLPQILHALCWAHARRKFMDVIKAKGKRSKPGYADKVIDLIGELYDLERDWKKENCSDPQKVALRKEHSRPILEELFQLLEEIAPITPEKGLLGVAVNYTLKRKEGLMLYLEHGFLSPDNNLAENAIRPFVIGRKNWLFCSTPAGAAASARLYSLIETAKANDLDPFEYLKFLFEQLPDAETNEQLRSLLPQNIELPSADDSNASHKG